MQSSPPLWRVLVPATCLIVCLASADCLPSQGLYDPDTLRTFDFKFASANWYSNLRSARSSKTNVKAELTVDNVVYKDVGVRFRGMSSYIGSGTKKSINLTMDAFVPDQELMGYDSLNLSNGYNDPTFCREMIAYQLHREYMPAPKANYVKVNINGAYFGLYVNVQQQDKKFIGQWYEDTSGNRYRCDPPSSAGNGNSALQWLGTTLQNYTNAYELKTDPALAVKPWEDIRNLCDVLNNTPNAQLSTELPKVFDVDQAMRYLGLQAVLVNLDSYLNRGNDYYLYHDPHHQLLSTLAWDMNESFGGYGAGMSVAQRISLTPFYNIRSSRPLNGKMYGTLPQWTARYMHHVKTILDQDFTWTKIGPLVAKYQSFIDAALQADPNKLYSYQQFKDNVTRQMYVNSGWFRNEIPGLKQLVDARVARITGMVEYRNGRPTITALSTKPTVPTPNIPVTVTAKVTNTVPMGSVTLCYRVVGAWLRTPMLDDGAHGDGAAGDDVYGAILPATMHAAGTRVHYYVESLSAAANGGACSLFPKTGSFQPPQYRVDHKTGTSPIRINELVAKNKTGVQDEQSQYEDWVELYNTSPNPVDVGGMYLTDAFSSPTKWQIPAGYTIPSKGALLVWCDNDPGDGPLHATFKLDGDGETVRLFAKDGETRVSQIRYGLQADDISNGWMADGNPSLLVAYKTPTPARPTAPDCASHGYWPVDHAQHRLLLEWIGTPRIGMTNRIKVSSAKANSAVSMYLAVGPGMLPIGGGLYILLGIGIDGPFVLPTDAAGIASIPVPIPNNPALKGQSAFLQVVGPDNSGVTLSNGAEIRICR
ncbi:MAG: CotH kinase family protein [Planctomycetota bacterium]|nr:CotH kinase family protein [Planctomycetota bacterium]